jgi:Skp family chaperone for outer membrane proteins
MKKIIIALVAFLFVQTGICYYLVHKSEKKIVYADAIKLFNGYKYKLDMEQSSQASLNRLKNSLDSATAIYKVNPNDPQVQQVVLQKQELLNQSYSKINKEINDKVWERLNPKIQEFGKIHHIDMMIGANGMGTLLYAADSWDVTDDLIKYVNENYEKGN